MRRRLLFLLAAPLLALAFASPALAAVPVTDYQLYNGDMSFNITVVNNPSNYGVQAEVRCILPQGFYGYHYGNWVFSAGAVSHVGTNCDGTGNNGLIDRGYFRYKKSAPIRVDCWRPGLPRTGSC